MAGHRRRLRQHRRRAGRRPHSRLCLPAERAALRDGTSGDIGGTDLVPDFGGFYHDSARDKAGPDINLADLDNDGDLDLLQSFHCDVREPLLPYSPGEYRQGVFCWKNLLVETGHLRFEKLTGNGLACEAKLTYNREKQLYEPTGKAPGLPYISLADVDNDGLPDILAVGPADPGWAPRAEYVHGRFWRNLGDFRFQEMTEQADASRSTGSTGSGTTSGRRRSPRASRTGVPGTRGSSASRASRRRTRSMPTASTPPMRCLATSTTTTGWTS